MFNFLLGSIGAIAQTGDNSPFSRFGIGDIVDPSFMHNRSMGSLGSSYADMFNINIKNPASYSFLKSTAFELGIQAKYSELSDEDREVNLWSGGLEYISLAFPLRNPINEIVDRVEKNYALGMNLSLVPFSQVNYNISSFETDPDFGLFQRNYQGKGGSYKLMWGNSFKYKNLSVGLNLGYLFGHIQYERNIIFDDLQYAYENRYNQNFGINGFVWNAGMIYSHLINKKEVKDNRNARKKMLNIGLQGNTDMRFYSNSIIEKVGLFSEAGITDTLVYSDEIQGEGTLPAEFGIGLMYISQESWAVGIDYNHVFWSHYENEARPETLSDGFRLSIGGHIIPDSRSLNQYFKRVKYRLGAYYQNDPKEIEDTSFKSYGLTLGAGFPLIYQRKYRANMNPMVQLGRKGVGSPVQENFIKIGFGFTFNDDEWFLKRKYN